MSFPVLACLKLCTAPEHRYRRAVEVLVLRVNCWVATLQDKEHNVSCTTFVHKNLHTLYTHRDIEHRTRPRERERVNFFG